MVLSAIGKKRGGASDLEAAEVKNLNGNRMIGPIDAGEQRLEHADAILRRLMT